MTNLADATDPPSSAFARSPITRRGTPGRWLPSASRCPTIALPRCGASTPSPVCRGEGLGLRWRDIDWIHKRLSVVLIVTPVNGRSAIGPAKTDGSTRTIDLDDETLAVLKAYRAVQAAERLAVGPGYRDEDLVFAQPDGERLNPVSITATFGRLVKASGLLRIRLHDLRHSYVSIMLASGEPVKVVSERAGHSAPSFTMARYQHILPGMQSAAAQRFADLVDGGR